MTGSDDGLRAQEQDHATSSRRLSGRVALVTGGSSGIGAATAARFAQEGAVVVIVARQVERGESVAKALIHAGGRADFLSCDVSDPADVDAVLKELLRRHGRLDVVINNAGAGVPELFPNESDAGWQRVLGVNLLGSFHVCRSAWPHLIAAGGASVVNMSSTAAVMGFNDSLHERVGVLPPASYAVAKAGVEALTRYLASLGARHGIRVNCVRPGQILTPLVDRGGRHVFQPLFDATQLLPRCGQADDVAQAILFLASGAASFISGEVLSVDGGMPIKL